MCHLSAYADLCAPLVANAVKPTRRSLLQLERRREKQISDVPLRQERVLLLAGQRHRQTGNIRHLRQGGSQTPATAINLQIARAYLNAADPKLVSRTWQEVMAALVVLKRGSNQQRWERAIEDRSFNPLRQLALIETRSDHFLKVLEEGKVSR